MRRICAAVIAAVLLQPPASRLVAQGSPTKCGVERWPVKIAVDADAARIDTRLVRVTIAELAALPRPGAPLAHRNRVSPFELKAFRVVGVVGVERPEGDGDIHIVLHDLEDTARTIIAEVPDSACALGSRYIHAFADSYRALRSVRRNSIVIIDGIGFFDYIHGQTGVAPNGFELHPVIRVRVVGIYGNTPRVDSTTGAAFRRPNPKPQTPDLQTKVWLNTRSNVYHCPGTRWYGATSRGQYMTEQQAIAAGARPAYGRRC